MVSTAIKVEVSPSSLASCRKCGGHIPKDTLRIKHLEYGKRKRWYHLMCFRPISKEPLRLDWDVTVCGRIGEEQREQLRQWVEVWNQQYVSTVEKVPAQYLAKAVQTCHTPLRRLLLEVFQYLSVRETELLVGLTCKAWFHVSRDSEHWKSRYLQEFKPVTMDADMCYRTQYLVYYRGSCWNCQKFLSLRDIEMMCPLHKRPLCKTCKDQPICHLVDIGHYVTWHSISPSLLKYLEIPMFKLEGTKKAYKADTIDRVIAYGLCRRAKLVNSLLERHSEDISPALIEEIRTFEVEAKYKSDFSAGVLMKFLGKCEENEDFERSVQTFARKLSNTPTNYL